MSEALSHSRESDGSSLPPIRGVRRSSPMPAETFLANLLQAPEGTHPSLRPAVFGGPETRTRWERRYRVGLFVTDTVVVCIAVALAQYVRFGPPSVRAGDRRSDRELLGNAGRPVARSARSVRNSVPPGHRCGRRGIPAHRQRIVRGVLPVAPVRGSPAPERGSFRTDVLAIGERRDVSALAAELLSQPTCGYDVVGVGIPGHVGGQDDVLTVGTHSIPILGDEVSAMAALERSGADTVAVTSTDHFGAKGLRELACKLEAVDVDLVVTPGMMDVAGARLTLRPAAGFSLLHVERPQYRGAKRFQKRALDICCAMVALVLTGPMLLVAAIMVKLDTRGSVHYTAERIGMDGRPCNMLKLRSMITGADKQLPGLVAMNESQRGVLFKIHDDPRLSPGGTDHQAFQYRRAPAIHQRIEGRNERCGSPPASAARVRELQLGGI